jgi:hypothetical protein
MRSWGDSLSSERTLGSHRNPGDRAVPFLFFLILLWLAGKNIKSYQKHNNYSLRKAFADLCLGSCVNVCWTVEMPSKSIQTVFHVSRKNLRLTVTLSWVSKRTGDDKPWTARHGARQYVQVYADFGVRVFRSAEPHGRKTQSCAIRHWADVKSSCMCEAKRNVLTVRNDTFADYRTRSYGEETFYFLESVPP